MSKERKTKAVKDKVKTEKAEPGFAYKVLSTEHTRVVNEITDVDLLQEKVSEMMSIESSDVDLKAGASLDYYVAALWWAKEQSFTLDQLSAFFTVVYVLLENIRDKQYRMVDALLELKKMFAGVMPSDHAGHAESLVEMTASGIAPPPLDPPGMLDCFDVSAAKKIIDYVHVSLFQHYRLYEFIFSHTQAEEIIGTDLDVEVPPELNLPWPPPLEEALLETQYIAANTVPTPPNEVADATEKPEVAEVEELDTQKVKDLLSELSAEQVMEIVGGVLADMLSGLKDEVAVKLRDKENTFINRINKIHKKLIEPSPAGTTT